MIRLALGAALGVAIGFFLARLVPGAPRPAAAPARAGAPVRCTAQLSPGDLEAMKLAVAPVRPAQTSTAAPAPNPAPAPPPTAQPAPPPSPETSAAIAQAYDLVDDAIAARAWTDDDVARFRALLPRLPDEDRTRAMAKVITAINAQQMRPTARFLF